MNIILITGCINTSNKSVALKDVNSRLQQYLETLRWAIEDSEFDTIVFCENSNYKGEVEKYIKKFKTNKKIEYLTFKATNDTNKYNIGIGEIEIYKYAFKHSKYLKKSKYFWKLTGRLKVDNINNILKKCQNKQSVCMQYYKWFDTRFYKMRTDDYFNYFNYDTTYNLIVKDNNSLEKVFFEIMKKNNVKCKNFPLYPDFSGYSGNLGINWKLGKLHLMINNIFCKIGLFNNQFIQYLLKKVG